MWAWLSQSSFASQAIGWQNGPISFGNDQNVHSRIIYTLGIPSTSSRDILAGDYLAYCWGYRSRSHLIKRLLTLECLELLVGVETGLKNKRKSVEIFTEGKHSGLNCSAGMLAGSTPMTEIFYEYLSFTRLSKLLTYPESTAIPLDECPVLLSILFFLDIYVVGEIISDNREASLQK